MTCHTRIWARFPASGTLKIACLCLLLSLTLIGNAEAQQSTDMEIASYIAQLKEAKDWSKARDALVAIGQPAVLPLVKALKEQDVDTRKRAAQVLGRMGGKASDALPALTEMLKGKDLEVRTVSAESLGKIAADLRDAQATDTVEALKTARNARHWFSLIHG